MSNKPMKAASSRHSGHPKDCALCNPKKSQKYQKKNLDRKSWKNVSRMEVLY